MYVCFKNLDNEWTETNFMTLLLIWNLSKNKNWTCTRTLPCIVNIHCFPVINWKQKYWFEIFIFLLFTLSDIRHSLKRLMFVWGFSYHSRIFHSYGDILKLPHLLWHRLYWTSTRTRDIHPCCQSVQQWTLVFTSCFYDWSVAADIRTVPTSCIQGKCSTIKITFKIKYNIILWILLSLYGTVYYNKRFMDHIALLRNSSNQEKHLHKAMPMPLH